MNRNLNFAREKGEYETKFAIAIDQVNNRQRHQLSETQIQTNQRRSYIE